MEQLETTIESSIKSVLNIGFRQGNKINIPIFRGCNES